MYICIYVIFHVCISDRGDADAHIRVGAACRSFFLSVSRALCCVYRSLLGMYTALLSVGRDL